MLGRFGRLGIPDNPSQVWEGRWKKCFTFSLTLSGGKGKSSFCSLAELVARQETSAWHLGGLSFRKKFRRNTSEKKAAVFGKKFLTENRTSVKSTDSFLAGSLEIE
jgi:hypothetical protein